MTAAAEVVEATQWGEQPVTDLLVRSVKQLAAGVRRRTRSEVTAETVTDWMAGRALPPADMQRAVAAVLGLDLASCWSREVIEAAVEMEKIDA